MLHIKRIVIVFAACVSGHVCSICVPTNPGMRMKRADFASGIPLQGKLSESMSVHSMMESNLPDSIVTHTEMGGADWGCAEFVTENSMTYCCLAMRPWSPTYMSTVPGKGELVYNAPLLIPGGEHVTGNDSGWFTIPVKPCSVTREPMGTLLLAAIVTVRVFKRPTMGLDWATTLVCKLGFTT